MNKLGCFIMLFISCRVCDAQILCIYCYDQSDSISANVNNLILNGGFENGCNFFQDFCPNSITYACDITNWTCNGGGTNTYATIYDTSITIIPEGAKTAYFGNQYCHACSPIDYDTSCIINIGCTVTGIPAGYPISKPTFGGTNGVSLEQTVTGLVVGNTYVLEFWAGGEDVWFPTERGLFAVDIGFGDTLLRNKNTAPWATTGTRYIIEFNATSISHAIKFTNWGHICNTCTELILDDVRLYTVAELDASVPNCALGINSSLSLTNGEGVIPNPFTNELIVEANNNDVSEIILYDIASRKILQQAITSSTTLNTEQLAKGIYIYEVRSKNGVVKKGKVVKY